MLEASGHRERRLEVAFVNRAFERLTGHSPGEVIARPPSRAYKVRKFVARNRALVTGATLAVLAFLLQRWGFVLLEGVWTLVSVVALIMRLQGKTPAAGH